MGSRGKNLSFAEWIGLNSDPDYSQARFLGPVVGAAMLLLALALVIGGAASLLHFVVLALKSGADHEALRNIGLVVAAILGAPFVLWRALVAQKQANTAEQSHITDQINKAVSGLGAEKTIDRIGRPVKIFTGQTKDYTRLVDATGDFQLPPKTIEIKRYYDHTPLDDGEIFDGLHISLREWDTENTKIEWQSTPLEIGEGEAIASVGDWSVFSETVPNIEVRIGAIYALERISQDSRRDHIQIMEILSAYIRENSRVRSLVPSEPPFNRSHPRADIQSALDVIGRRLPEHIVLEHSQKYRLDLRNVDLSGANFSRGNFEGAMLSGSRLEASIFRNTNLRAARLEGCLLNFADFFDANLCGAVLDRAVINRLGGLDASVALAKDMRGLSLAGADISAVDYLPEADTHTPTFGTKDTKTSPHLQKKREELSEDLRKFMYSIRGHKAKDDAGTRSRLKDAGLLYWSPFDSDDLATGSMRAKLWKDISLCGFPFTDT